MVIRRSIHERYPWAALNIYNAFAEARAAVLRARDTALLAAFRAGPDRRRRHARARHRSDGLWRQDNRKVLETITQYVHEQGLSPRRVALEEIFAPSTMDL